MSISDRVNQKLNQINRMSQQEGLAYIDQLGRKALADDKFNRALESDKNWEICQNVDEETLERLTRMADAGNKQAMYDTAAVHALIGHELKKQNELQKSIISVVRAHLYVDEAQNA